MLIKTNHVVQFDYWLYDDAGNLLETSEGATASLALIGHNNLLPGLEQAMLEKSLNDEFTVTLSPEEAYGNYKSGMVQRVASKYLKHEGKLTVGKPVRLQTDQGIKLGTILKAGKFMVDVDMNHPLAGQTLTFKVRILSVRDASQEEISHGHAHGAGGHNH